MKNLFKLCAVIAMASMVACGPTEEPQPTTEPDQTSNNGGNGKGDTPNTSDYDGVEQCLKREQDMVFSSRRAFTEEGIRWAVADVEGVNARNRDDRGQEYTEYFAAIQNIPDGDGELGEVIKLGHGSNGRLEYELSDGQIEWLEDNEFEEVGACVFTSWHSDVPAMDCEANDECPSIVGDFKVSLEDLRMKVSFNSNGAARDLIGRCALLGGGTLELNDGQLVRDIPPLQNGNPEDPDDILNRPFMRGCGHIDGIFQTGWRRSDPSVCAGVMRIAECGCGLAETGSIVDLVDAVLPSPDQQLEKDGKITMRGFRIGGWTGVGDEHLPAGCEYVRTGDDASTIVRCALSGAELLDNSQDIKEHCRNRYANDLTVNVPIAAEAVACNPPEDGLYAGTCTENPWVLDYQVTR